MRLVVIGCEYTGKTTLIDGLDAWGKERGIHFHLDDHFSIPDQFFLKPADQEAMVALPPIVKERFQRFQIYYHIHVMRNHEDTLLGGFHIEEAIYGPLYYYPNDVFPAYHHKVESEFPEDTILLLLTASPDVIRHRMETAPHSYPVVKPDDVERVSALFENEYRQSWIARKLRIDTSDLTPETLLSTFQKQVVPLLDTRDLLRWRALG